jgi:hypothetical protein
VDKAQVRKEYNFLWGWLSEIWEVRFLLKGQEYEGSKVALKLEKARADFKAAMAEDGPPIDRAQQQRDFWMGEYRRSEQDNTDLRKKLATAMVECDIACELLYKAAPKAEDSPDDIAQRVLERRRGTLDRLAEHDRDFEAAMAEDIPAWQPDWQRQYEIVSREWQFSQQVINDLRKRAAAAEKRAAQFDGLRVVRDGDGNFLGVYVERLCSIRKGQGEDESLSVSDREG